MSCPKLLTTGRIAENLSATVFLTDGPDKVLLRTTLPCPFSKAFLPGQPPLILEFNATADTGEQYCIEHFGVKPAVRDIRQ